MAKVVALVVCNWVLFLVGAACFVGIESANEDASLADAAAGLSDSKAALAKTFGKSDFESFTGEQLEALERFASAHAQGKGAKAWTFWRSVHFCLTIATTIGYGDMAPQTDNGKLFCCFYGRTPQPATIGPDTV